MTLLKNIWCRIAHDSFHRVTWIYRDCLHEYHCDKCKRTFYS